MPVDPCPPSDPDTMRPTRAPTLYPLSPMRCPTTLKLLQPVDGPFVNPTPLTTGPSELQAPDTLPPSTPEHPTTLKLVDPVVGPFVAAAELTTGPS